MGIINDGCYAYVHRCSFNVFFKEPLHAYQVLWGRVRQTANSVNRARCNAQLIIKYFLNSKLGMSSVYPVTIVLRKRTLTNTVGYYTNVGWNWIWVQFRIKIRQFNNMRARSLGFEPPRLLITHQTQNGASIGRRVLRRRRTHNILKRGY